MLVENEIQHSNISEEEMGALHGIHVHLNAIAAVQRSIKHGPSAEFCVDCGDIIPQARREAVQGCDTCISCQELREK